MPKYVDISCDIEHKINKGQYDSGQKLPSVREAAERYGCSVNTVARAYGELEKRHIVYAIAQSGYYVVDKPRNSYKSDKAGIIDFAAVSPDPSVFPYLDFQHCLNQALDTYKVELFTCGDAEGLESLRHALVSHLASDQVFARLEQIVVTPGANRALEILTKMPFPNGHSVILVEQPSYDIYLRFLEAEGIPVRGIARTTEGVDLSELEEQFKYGDIKFFYTMSRYHSPLGSSYSSEERRAIARLASKYDVYIVEDDYMADLGEQSGLDPIYAYDRTSHAVYVKSFSKTIFPGLRLGAAVLPQHLVEAFCVNKRYADTSQLSQAALEVYIKSGMYERHKRIVSRQYTARMHALHESVRRHNRDGVIDIPDVRYGVYVPFKLPQSLNLDRLIERLAAKNIIVVPSNRAYLTNYWDRDKFLRISISRTLPNHIEEGVRTIIEEVRKELRFPY